jgi:hypothetical protein
MKSGASSTPLRNRAGIVELLHGSGPRLLEALRRRVEDDDFARGQVTVHDPK